MDERTKMADLIPADGQPGRAIGVGQARHAAPAKDSADGRGRVTEERSESIRALAPGLSRGDDALDLVRWRGPRRATRSGAPVDQAGRSLEPIPSDPLVACRSADALSLGRSRHRPALAEHAIDQELATEWVETRRTMRHESLLAVRSFNTLYRARRLSLVNNVPNDEQL